MLYLKIYVMSRLICSKYCSIFRIEFLSFHLYPFIVTRWFICYSQLIEFLLCLIRNIVLDDKNIADKIFSYVIVNYNSCLSLIDLATNNKLLI